MLKYFSYFYQKTGFDISCNLHEMSNSVFWEKEDDTKRPTRVDMSLNPNTIKSGKKKKNIINLANGDNLHEMSNPVFWEKEEIYGQFIIC